MYGTPTKNAHDGRPPRSAYKFFESYNIKCLMNELSVADKENAGSANKLTAKKGASPLSHYKHIYKIIQTSTVLRQSPTSAKRQLAHKLSSIVSLDCTENLNGKFDDAEAFDLNLNRKNAGFSEFIDHMRADPGYAAYFNCEAATTQQNAKQTHMDANPALYSRKQFYGNIATRLIDLLN